MDLISVIVPVYKVEKYLDKCVRSIVDQTYTNLEILLVDDGSPDNCGAMCDAWAQKDKRIRVIHKENGGLSDARNVGMAAATGEYIAFVDSDDWVHVRYIERLYAALTEHNAPISACSVRFVCEAEEIPAQSPANSIALTTEEALRTLIRGEGVRAVAWNKLYHRDLLQDETFPIGKYHEDEFFTYRLIAKAQTVAYVPEELYYYLQRGSGIMGSVSIRHLDMLEAWCERLCFLKEQYPALYKKDKVTFAVGCVNFYQMATGLDKAERQKAQKIVKAYRTAVSFSFREWRQCTFSEKVYIAGGRLGMGLFCRLLQWKGRS